MPDSRAVARPERAPDRLPNNITLGELVNNQEILDVSGRQHQHETQRNARTRDAIDVKLRA